MRQTNWLGAMALVLAGCGHGEFGVDEFELDLSDDSRASVADIADEILREDHGPNWDLEASEDHFDDESSPVTMAAAPGGAPNIVVIIADDLPRGLLGFEGNNRIDTPHLDALKNSGVYFDRFYLPIGQCGPSRTILWTGLHPTANGVETNNAPLRNRNTPVLPKALKENGYRTGFFGKCHIGTPRPTDLQHLWRFDTIFHTRGVSKTHAGDKYKHMNLWDPVIYQIRNSTGAEPGMHYTELITKKATEFMEREHDAGRRFFVWLAHRAPHIQTTMSTDANGGWYNGPPNQRYRVGQMPIAIIPEKAGDTLVNKPPQQANSPSRYAFEKRLSREPKGFKEHIRRMFEQTRFMDEQVGVLMAKLRELGELDNTLVVFVSDNGTFMGNRRFAGKGPFNYDDVTRVPLVMSWPGHLPAGKTRKALIQSTDVSATLLAAAKLPRLPGSRSSSFWPVAMGEKPDRHRKSVFFQYLSQAYAVSRVRGVLKDGYKLSHYLGSRYFAYVPENRNSSVPLIYHSPQTYELYNMSDDPHELTNLLPYRDKQPGALLEQLRNKPARRPILNNLLRTMAEQQLATEDDMGLRLENVRVRRRNGTTAVLQWRSALRRNGRPAAATSEVVFRQKNCAQCTVYEYDFKDYETDHDVVITNLEPGREYEALAISITMTANGGFARYIIPATVGANGYPGAGNPRLSYIWNSYNEVVVAFSPPPADKSARCLIRTGGGSTIADYQDIRKACVDDCRLLYPQRPHRSCSWNGVVFEASQ
ncbi:sulfatase-like hydrolase/transferase [Myxococcota bacterium]